MLRPVLEVVGLALARRWGERLFGCDRPLLVGSADTVLPGHGCFFTRPESSGLVSQVDLL